MNCEENNTQAIAATVVQNNKDTKNIQTKGIREKLKSNKTNETHDRKQTRKHRGHLKNAWCVMIAVTPNSSSFIPILLNAEQVEAKITEKLTKKKKTRRNRTKHKKQMHQRKTAFPKNRKHAKYEKQHAYKKHKQGKNSMCGTVITVVAQVLELKTNIVSHEYLLNAEVIEANNAEKSKQNRQPRRNQILPGSFSTVCCVSSRKNETRAGRN